MATIVTRAGNVIEVDFGRDVLCVQALKTGRYATGLLLIAQNAYHRLITPRGMLPGAPDFGLDLSELIGMGDSGDVAARLPGQIRNELVKDERIEDVQVEVVRSSSAGRVTYTITVSATTALGPFELVLAASDVSVDLLGITAEVA